jgi:hypothetical protein
LERREEPRKAPSKQRKRENYKRGAYEGKKPPEKRHAKRRSIDGIRSIERVGHPKEGLEREEHRWW